MRHLPNLITFSRIGVLIALLWLVLQEWTGAATLAFFCILYGSVSDFLDGYIARKYNLITNFGKIMDATVDKVMTLGSFILLVWLGLIEPLLLASIIVALIAVREIGITILRFVATRKNLVLAAEKSGKRKTIWQTTAICVFFAIPMFERDVATWIGADLSLFGTFVRINAYLYFVLAAWLTIGSGYKYLRKYGWVLIPGRTNPELES
ncbi:CDP-diacylglycerol--glycerol-3-phosphate 3-phosphatidyltransferase [Puniceicoccales bacterium CK1056]|uniref:CDP-diacylglycerol--glycerol-3-phosphate 3-phosphatidyltransferase n=1 Tax=Oceanipulchritudo coccoides TaxID=2706888 RepID=A0A6B2M0J3_9BACT|nr:CDP-diacylglycerol--glycerol-3-phosphate 3-phosphatidyltransferase [Oceanipulchritudo coccoides]NDV61829.1 CDP-diacylglycerol--glycerol-3-phosphate 3-phosphatidyltransferase [Oceanipulchritudo coccoides]